MDTVMMRWFCRAYLLMLYAYPREFRMQFGGEMQQLFRDRCRQVSRTPGRWQWLRFAMQSAADWISTLFQERMAAVREITVQDAANKTFQVVRTVWSVGRRGQPRGFVAEWAMTIIVFLFATTTLVQAYVVPTGSMESTVMIGDHMLVDRLSYSSRRHVGVACYCRIATCSAAIRLLPLPRRCSPDVREARHRHSRRPHPSGEQAGGAQRPTPGGALCAAHRFDDRRLSRQLPAVAGWSTTPRGRDMLTNHVKERRIDRAAGLAVRDGRQPRELGRQPLLGAGAARLCGRQASIHLLVV